MDDNFVNQGKKLFSKMGTVFKSNMKAAVNNNEDVIRDESDQGDSDAENDFRRMREDTRAQQNEEYDMDDINKLA